VAMGQIPSSTERISCLTKSYIRDLNNFVTVAAIDIAKVLAYRVTHFLLEVKGKMSRIGVSLHSSECQSSSFH